MKRKRRIAALYKVEGAIRGSDPERRRAARQDLSRPLERVVFIRIHLCSRTRLQEQSLPREHK